jgi:hypothetical protein
MARVEVPVCELRTTPRRVPSFPMMQGPTNRGRRQPSNWQFRPWPPFTGVPYAITHFERGAEWKALLIILTFLNQAERCACKYIIALRYGVEFGAHRARHGSRLQLLPRGWSQRPNADTASSACGNVASRPSPVPGLSLVSLSGGLGCFAQDGEKISNECFAEEPLSDGSAKKFEQLPFRQIEAAK